MTRRHRDTAKQREEDEKPDAESPRLRVAVSPRRNDSASPLRFLIVFLLLLLGWIFLAPFLAERLIVEKPLEHSDAILILGGSATYKERTQKAAQLFKAGVAPKIYLTNDGLQGGWNQKEQRNPFFYERARWELIDAGVPENAIEVFPEIVEGTIYEAQNFAKFAKAQNLKSVVIVTSAYHSRRSVWTFEKILAQNKAEIQVGIVTAPLGELTPSPYFWWLSADGWRYVGGEYMKSAYYSVYY